MAEDEARAESGRRRLLYLGIAAAGGLVALGAGGAIAGTVLDPLGRQPPLLWARVCSLSEIYHQEPRLFPVVFPHEEGPQRWEERLGVFVIRKDDDILAFSNLCTHMRCSVRWLADRQQILCPCHGGIYDRWGNLAGGPPAFSLPLFQQRLEGNDLYVANRLIRRPIVSTWG
ncbi:MAG: QcrA and Rieske domain-containing protein [Chloroflexota bacterium]